MAHTGSTTVHGPSWVHHHTTLATALAIVIAASVAVASLVAIGLVRTAAVPAVVIDTPPVATAAPWVRGTLQSEYLLHVADHGTWGVGATHPVAHVPSTVDRVRAGIQSEYVLALAVQDHWNDPFPAAAPGDRLESGYLRALAVDGGWGIPSAGDATVRVPFLDRFENGYLRELAESWGN